MGRSAIGAVAALLLALVAGAGALTTHRVSTAPAKPSAAGAAAGLPALRVPAATHARLALRGGGPPLPLFVGIGLSGAAAALLKLNENVRTAVMRFLDKQVLSKLRKSKRRNVRDGTWAQELQPSEEITSGASHLQERVQVLDQTAVLIVRHGPTGSSGFIINRATQFTVGDVTKKLPVFEQNRLFLGGDIGEGVYMIHGVPGLRNATQVSEGLYYGGSEHAMELVQKGKARSEDFRFFFKYTAWAPGALQAEVQAGCWCPIKTSLDLVLRPKQHEIHFSKAHKVYWHELLKTLGGRFDNISSETLRKEEMERAKMEEWVTLLQDGSNVSVPDHEFVENGALAMASVAGQIPPELGEKVYTQIEAVTAATQKALGGDAAPAETLRALSAEFFKTFSAVSAEDAPPTALLVDRVAASQQGEPLALAPLYMAAARALGVPLRALNCSTQMRFGAELYLRYDAPREATAEEKEPEPRDDSDALFVALGEAGAVMSKDECRGKLPEEMQDDASMQPMPHVQLYSRVMHKMANSLAAKNEEQEVLVWLQQIRILQAAINTVTIMHLEEEARRDPEKFRRAQEAARAAAQERARQVEGGGQPRELFLKDIIKDDQVLLAGGGKTVTGADLKGKVVALYFSASWCAPCKQFTPKLIQTYSKLVVADGKDFEVVFVSVDRDQESFDAYFNQMPWLALEWANADERASISQACQVTGIPKLAVFGADGALITEEGRDLILGDPMGDKFPWGPAA